VARGPRKFRPIYCFCLLWLLDIWPPEQLLWETRYHFLFRHVLLSLSDWLGCDAELVGASHHSLSPRYWYGIQASTVSIFCAENVLAVVRSGLVICWQIWTAFGIFLRTCANLAVKDTGSISWRLQFGPAFIPAVSLWAGVYFCLESPRWYIKKGKYMSAFRSLKRSRNTELQAARDLYYIYAQIRLETELVKKK
jgi:hypothetical protein